MSTIRHPADAAQIFEMRSFSSPRKNSPQEEAKKQNSRGWFLPYLIGFLSGMLIAYIITVLMGYIINKGLPDNSVARTGFYGYLIGCQGP